MEFRILGPVGASGTGGEVALGGRRHRVLLAALLMHAGATVSAGGGRSTPTVLV